MNKGLVLGLVAAAVAFGAGAFLGRASKSAMVITSSSSGASYGGGFRAEGDAATSAAAATSTGAIKSVAGPATDKVMVVKDGESIQGAVKRAEPGTTIRVMPGTYHETVYVDKDDMRIIGVIEGGRRAVLDGEGKLNDAILYSGNIFVVENLMITKYKGNGIMGQAGNNFEIRNNVVMNLITEVVGTGERRTGLVRLNRPKQLNALSDGLMDELGAVLKSWDADASIGCIVITGSEKAFAAGAHISMLATYDFARAYSEDMITRNWEAIRSVRKPVIAAVAGFALGGGCELAMMSDIVIAADSARFGQPEIKLCLIPGAGGTQRLPRAIGKAKAMDLVLTGRMMDAAEAERAGLGSSPFQRYNRDNSGLCRQQQE